MQLSGNRLKTLRGPLMVGVAACFFLGVVAYWYTDGFYFPPDPAPLPPPKASARATEPQMPPRAEAADSSMPEKSSEAPPMAVDAGNLRTFAEKQAQLDVMKLDVAIAEQQAKLNELKNGKPVPVVQPIPQPVAVLPAELPPLPPLATTRESGLPSLPPVGPAPAKRRTSGLVAVQGVDGSLSAVFATGSGKKTVRVGDSIMGSKVRVITLDGVTLASGKILTLED